MIVQLLTGNFVMMKIAHKIQQKPGTQLTKKPFLSKLIKEYQAQQNIWQL